MSDGTTTTRGQIGAEIFEQVEKLVSDEHLNRSEAFQRISEQTGRRPGTVAANYYRVARQRGVALQPRRRRSTTGRQTRTGRRGRGGSDVQAALSRAIAAVEELADVARRQEQELNRLRDESAQLTELRQLLKRVK